MLDQKKMDRFKECGGSAALELRGEIIDALKRQIEKFKEKVK